MNTISYKPDNDHGVAVSVIVPVYNASKYLDQCLGSIQGQSLKNFEVIVVNDASTDDSKDVVHRYMSCDNRFKLITFESNRGLPAARNAGVELANSEYLVHLDSDDFWLDSQTLESLYTTATLENAQVLRFNGLDIINDDLAAPIIPSFPAVNVELISDPRLWIFRSVFLYFFKTDFLRKHQLSFDESIGIGEDAIFLSKALPKATNISSVPGFFYAYRRHHHSMMGNHWGLTDFIEDQCASDIVVSNLKDIPEIATWYVFNRYTDYWINKLLPRAVIQLDEKSRFATYDRYRKTLDKNKSAFQSRSRVGLKFLISKWLLVHGKYRMLDHFIISLNQKKRIPGIHFGFYLNLAIQIKRGIEKFRLRGINYLKGNRLLLYLLSKREEHFSQIRFDYFYK